MTVREAIGALMMFAPLAFLATMGALVTAGIGWTERETTVSIAFFLAGVSTAPLVTFLDRRVG